LQEDSSLNDTTVLLEKNGSDIEFDDDATLTIDEATKGKVSVGTVSSDSALTINYKEETETTPSQTAPDTDDTDSEEPETQEPAETTPETIEVVVRYELLNGKTIADSTKESVATPHDAAGYIAAYVHDLSKGINGYNYVDYTYEISDTQIVITLRYEEKEAYSVAVNYYLENETTPIHFANVITGLKEGESYDASRFNAIEIEGYTYVSTTGSLTGTVSGADHVINITCYYKKNATTSSTTTTTTTPEKGEVVNTSTQTNSTMYLIIGLAAIVVVVILLVVLLRKKKDDK
jgi:LPXTG-motif cell wall-anchored protein